MTTHSANTPAITAVIPAYRSADRIGTAIKSMLAQDGVDSKVIVVVDDQLPETEAASRGYGPAVQIVVNTRNLGSAVSRNVGLELVETPYVIFLDSDDWIEGRLLACLCDAVARDNADFGLGTYVNLTEKDGHRDVQCPPNDLSEAQLFAQWLIGETYVPPCSLVWRTDSVRRIGGWDSQIRRGDDAELACRALLLGCRFTTGIEGHGVYLFHEGPHRVSRQSSRCADLKTLIDKLVALPGAKLSRCIVHRAAAVAYYEVARIAFMEGNRSIGRSALKESRQLGFKGHRGGLNARLMGCAIGLENRIRIRQIFQAG